MADTAKNAAPLTAIIVAWMRGRGGRTVRLKLGKLQAEAHSVAVLERLLKLTAEYSSELSAPDGPVGKQKPR